jgi:glutaredoxin
VQPGLTLAWWTRVVVAGFLGLALWPAAVSADVVVLKNGARFDGVILENSPTVVTVRSDGAVWTFTREKVASIQSGGGRSRAERPARASRQTMVSTVRPVAIPMDPTRRNPAAPLAEPRVIVYGTSWCNFCRRARSYFTDRGIPYLDKDVERDPEARAEVGRKCVAAGTSFTGSVPVLDVDGEIIHGFDVQRVERALQQHEG